MVFLLFSLTCCFDVMDNYSGLRLMLQKMPKVQNINMYQTVIRLTGKQNEIIQENYIMEKEDSKKQIHSPITQAQNIPNHRHDC